MGAESLFESETEALENLDNQLRESINLQSIADVPLGVFLSGGIDSSLIASMMQAQATSPIRTFTIGFDDESYDEAVHARKIASYLGTDHTELYVSADQARAVIPGLPAIYDEPFADSSQIPTYLVSKLARQHVTVSMSGDAGDELFGGYYRYFWASQIWNCVSWLPFQARRLIGHSVRALPMSYWDSLYQVLSKALPAADKVSLFGDKVYKMGYRMQKVKNIEDLYLSLTSQWDNLDGLVPDARELSVLLTNRSQWPTFPEHESLMMYLDTKSYLVDDILCKVDRASMAVSLETRVPFLDHRVIELAWRLPLNMKIRNGEGKWVLRQLLDKYVPRELIDRPKQGFGIPLGDWLRGPLREWAEALLDSSRLKNEGFLQAGLVQEKWAEHVSGKRNWEHHLWSVLMFQAWLIEQGS